MAKTAEKNPIQLCDVAVIIATRNDGEKLRVCLESVLQAGKGQAEVWVVDDASTDDTSVLLKEFSDRMQVLRGEGKGPGRARNQALEKIQRPWVAFVDADCRVAPDWLEELCVGIRHQPASVASVGGPQVISRDAGPTERNIGLFLESVGFVSDYVRRGHEIRPVQHNPSCNVLYARKLLSQVGGFDESLWPCEDLELDLRLRDSGFGAVFHPGARVEHRRPENFLGLWKMMKRYGFGHAQLVKRRGLCQKLHVLPMLAPVFFGLWFGWLILRPGLAFWTLVGVFLVFALFFLFRTRSPLRSLLFSVYLSESLIAWLYGFFTGLRGKPRIASA